jgi:hypothetical protein
MYADRSVTGKRNAVLDRIFPEGIRISWKLFLALLFFTGLILMIVWIFQIFHAAAPIYTFGAFYDVVALHGAVSNSNCFD